MTTELIISLGGILLLVILGLYLLQGKGAWLIAGYNTMPKEDKAKYDETALCKATGKLILGVAFSTVLLVTGDFFNNSILLIAGIGITVFIILFSVIYINTGSRYKKKN